MTGELLRRDDPGYGSECPDCGEPKTPTARRCRSCANKAEGKTRKGKPNFAVRVEREDAIYSVGRRESIISFRHEDGRLRSLHCFGPTVTAQTADGLARLGEGWEPVCRSTPESILTDLRGRKNSEGEWLVAKAGL